MDATSTGNRWAPMSPEMFKDAIWWIIFSLVEFEFYRSQFWHHAQMIRNKTPCVEDVWIPTNQRICCLSAMWQSGKWDVVKQAVAAQVHVLPYSLDIRLYIIDKFRTNNEGKLVHAIQDFLIDQTKPVWCTFPNEHTDSSSSSSSESPRSNMYIGTSTIAERRFQYRASK